MSINYPTDNALMAYMEGAQGRSFDHAQLFPPDATPMRRLPDVALATGRIALAPLSTWRTGIVFNVTARLHLWAERDTLDGRSLVHIARHVEAVFYPRPRLLRTPWRGLEVLRLVDATDDTRVAITVAVPARSNPLRYDRVRLRDHLATLTA